MQINMFFISSAITLFLSLVIGFLVYLKSPHKKIRNPWLAFCLGASIWCFGSLRFSTILSEKEAVFWWQVANIGVISVPALFFHFINNMLSLKRKREVMLWHILALIFIITNIFYKEVFIGKLRLIHNQFYWISWGSSNILHIFMFASLWVFLLPYSFTLMILKYKEVSGIERNQLKYFILGAAVSWSGGFGNFMSCINPNVYPIFNFMVGTFSPILGYAILKYRLMDIKVALTRAGIFVMVYAFVLGVPFFFGYRYGLWQLSTWITVFLATLGPFIYIYIDRKAEERLLKQQRRYQNTLKQASLGMTRIRNLRRLLDLITHIVTKTVKISFAAIYLYNQETNEYVLQVSRDKGRMTIPKLTSDNPLITWIMLKQQPLIYEEVKRQVEDTNDSTYRHLAENMRLLTATLVIPSFLEDRLVGFFVFGEKASGQIYTPDDLNVFQVLASQAALAIENARFFEETKQMHEQIAQAEKMATVGTMADGLSHQINNRFYALSLIAADTIDTIKVTDTSKCSPEVKEAFNQISHALERVKANVMQGGEVVKGILKYTRKGEEGLEALTLDQILDSTLDMVQYKVKLSEIDIIRNYSKDHPKIRGNSVQLQEVFFNFIDNGYDSTVERKTILKEAGYRGRITFSYQAQENGTLLITAEDNGMGIKEEDKKKLFTPFFTTKVSSRQGTGLGLYVIKRVIEEFHKGRIWFESEYGKGTKFLVELPIAKQ